MSAPAHENLVLVQEQTEQREEADAEGTVARNTEVPLAGMHPSLSVPFLHLLLLLARDSSPERRRGADELDIPPGILWSQGDRKRARNLLTTQT
jgi:hypothetical protein